MVRDDALHAGDAVLVNVLRFETGSVARWELLPTGEGASGLRPASAGATKRMGTRMIVCA